MEIEKINRNYEIHSERGFVKSVLPLRHFIFEDLNKHRLKKHKNESSSDYAYFVEPTEINELKEKISMNA